MPCRRKSRFADRGITNALLALVLLLGPIACQTEPVAEAPKPPKPDDASRQQLLIDAPQAVQDIAGFLLKYHTRHRAFPPTLEALRAEGIMPAVGYENLGQYAYHPHGLGILQDGRIILFVDSKPVLDNHIWCILQDPLSTANSAAITVTLVRMYELEQAAKGADARK